MLKNNIAQVKRVPLIRFEKQGEGIMMLDDTEPLLSMET